LQCIHFSLQEVEGKRSVDCVRVSTYCRPLDSDFLREVASTYLSQGIALKSLKIPIDFPAHAAQNCISYAAEWGDLQPSPTDCGLESFMKHIHEMLREKQLELARLQKEVEALRLVAGMIGEENRAGVADLITLPAAQEIPTPRPISPVAAAPPVPLSIPSAPLNPPPMIMRPPAPAFGEAALVSANDALAKRFP
jgi:hypothetical protein